MSTNYLLLLIVVLALPLHPSLTQCWNLVWEDDFSGSSLDQSKWEYMTGGGGWGNNELQYYTSGDNIEVSNGTLKITAREDLTNQYPSNDYTSSRLRTIYKGEWRYGRLEARMKMPAGQGFWPAFWMMPTYCAYGGWPASGEIDVMEYLGHQTSTAYGFSHYGNTAQDKSSSGAAVNPSTGTFADNFHTFGIEWSPGSISWQLDGVEYHSLTTSHPDFNTYGWPFDQQFHFILNLAVGGNWPGPPDITTVFPQTFEVDWVRVYQKLPDLWITGERMSLPNSSGNTYSVPDLASASYYWTAPSNATITSGQGTSEVNVTWNSEGVEALEVNTTTACGSATTDLEVEVTSNRWPNYGFEQRWKHWYSNEFDGADADFGFTTTGIAEGERAICATTNVLAGDPWDIQLTRPDVDITAGTSYTLTFQAKANAAGRDADLAIINNTSFQYYSGQSFPLTTSWQTFSHTFVAPVSATCLFNLDLGDELGTFCFDDFYFAETAALPVQWEYFRATPIANQAVVLSWKTTAEMDLAYYEIYRSTDQKNWEAIHQQYPVADQQYRYEDKPKSSISYYRIKAIDFDGSFTWMPIRKVVLHKSPEWTIHPNPARDQLFIEGLEESAELTILDGTGAVVAHVPQTASYSLSIDHLPNGIYFLQIKNRQEAKLIRWVKN